VSPGLLESGRAAAVATVGESEVRWYLTQPVTKNTFGAENDRSSGSNGAENHFHSIRNDVKSIDELLAAGKSGSPLPALGWSVQGAQTQIAYLCPTSGTSGVQVI
jgi:hypothetical protein